MGDFIPQYSATLAGPILTNKAVVCSSEVHLVSLSCHKSYKPKLLSGIAFLSGLVDSVLLIWLSSAFRVDFSIHPAFIMGTGWRSTLSLENQSLENSFVGVWFISVSYEEVLNRFHLELENALESCIVGETVVIGQKSII